MSKERQAVITGFGAITPLGLDALSSWESLIRGQTGIGNHREWMEAELPGYEILRSHLAGRIVAEVDLLEGQEIDFSAEINQRWLDRHASRAAIFGLKAASEALARAGLIDKSVRSELVEPERFGFFVGSALGGATLIGETQRRLDSNKRPGSTDMYKSQPDNPTVVAKKIFGAKGPSVSFTQACASSGVSIAYGAAEIRRGRADVIVTGGAESLSTPVIAQFEGTGAASQGDDPEIAARPFDRNTDGAVLGEGAGFLVLEDEKHALRRGAIILASLSGDAVTGGDGDPTLLDVEGAARCMRLALERAGVSREHAVGISPHATGTIKGDPEEARAIREVFESKDYQISQIEGRVFPTKGATGHSVGAAGGIEAVFSTMALMQELIPPSPKSTELIPEAEGFVPTELQGCELDLVLSNSMGFGDQNASVVISKYPTA